MIAPGEFLHRIPRMGDEQGIRRLGEFQLSQVFRVVGRGNLYNSIRGFRVRHHTPILIDSHFCEMSGFRGIGIIERQNIGLFDGISKGEK